METYGDEAGMTTIDIDRFYALGVDAVAAEARRIVGDGPTYISFDVDALDPAYAPGTGTPVVGGMTSYAVSYTHLDVYKRQETDLSSWRNLRRAGFSRVCNSSNMAGLPT